MPFRPRSLRPRELQPPTSRPRNASAPNNAPRSRQRRRAFKCTGLPLLATKTHILPVMVGDPELRKRASDLLLEQHGIYIQPINYPTVPGATVRLRITPTPGNGPRLIVQLTEALVSVWKELRLKLGERYDLRFGARERSPLAVRPDKPST